MNARGAFSTYIEDRYAPKYKNIIHFATILIWNCNDDSNLSTVEAGLTVNTLRTQSIFNRVQVRVQELFASSSSAKMTKFSKFEFAALDFTGRNGMNK